MSQGGCGTSAAITSSAADFFVLISGDSMRGRRSTSIFEFVTDELFVFTRLSDQRNDRSSSWTPNARQIRSFSTHICSVCPETSSSFQLDHVTTHNLKDCVSDCAHSAWVFGIACVQLRRIRRSSYIKRRPDLLDMPVETAINYEESEEEIDRRQ